MSYEADMSIISELQWLQDDELFALSLQNGNVSYTLYVPIYLSTKLGTYFVCKLYATILPYYSKHILLSTVFKYFHSQVE